jgi:hypothetical protein
MGLAPNGKIVSGGFGVGLFEVPFNTETLKISFGMSGLGQMRESEYLEMGLALGAGRSVDSGNDLLGEAITATTKVHHRNSGIRVS